MDGGERGIIDLYILYIYYNIYIIYINIGYKLDYNYILLQNIHDGAMVQWCNGAQSKKVNVRCEDMKRNAKVSM